MCRAMHFFTDNNDHSNVIVPGYDDSRVGPKRPCPTEESGLAWLCEWKAPDRWGEGRQRRLGFADLIAFHAQRRRRRRQQDLPGYDCLAHATIILRSATTSVSSRHRLSLLLFAAFCCRLPSNSPGSKQATVTTTHLAASTSSFVAVEN